MNPLFFLPHFGPTRSTPLYYENQTLGEEKNRVSGSQGLGMCFIAFTRVYATSIVAMYSPMLNLSRGFILSNHESYGFIFVLIHPFFFANSFPSYVLTCKYGCLIGFLSAALFDWCFTSSTGLFICLVNLGLRMIAKWTASLMVLLQSQLPLDANKVHHFSLILCVWSDLSTNVFLSARNFVILIPQCCYSWSHIGIL